MTAPLPAFPKLDPELRRTRLAPPASGSGPVRAVIDSDSYNEIDDLFALAHALLAPERVSVEALHAAPFHNNRSTGPADGMEKSYAEMRHLLELIGRPGVVPVCRGSEQYLADFGQPIQSEAARDLIARAHTGEAPLFVVAIGACTNVASALLLNPSLVERIVVVWLGGHAPHWPHTAEFNLKQDPLAARVLFESGVPLVHVPCMGVASHLITSDAELFHFLHGPDPLAAYLLQRAFDYGRQFHALGRVIWDLAATAWTIDARWLPGTLAPAPQLHDDLTWGPDDPSRHQVRRIFEVKRTAIFSDLFTRLGARRVWAKHPSL